MLLLVLANISFSQRRILPHDSHWTFLSKSHHHHHAVCREDLRGEAGVACWLHHFIYLYITCPIDYLDFCSSRFLTSGLRTSGFRISSHLESRPWTSGLRASGFQTSGHPDFWPFRFLPASIKCLDQDIYGIPCRLHQS